MNRKEGGEKEKEGGREPYLDGIIILEKLKENFKKHFILPLGGSA